MAKSLRAELLLWLLIPLIGVVGFNCWTSYKSARTNADLVINQMLLSSARVIAEQVNDVNGLVEVSVPPSALQMLASTDRDHVLYRVIAPSGAMIAGTRKDLTPPRLPADLQPIFFEKQIDNERYYAVAIRQPVLSKETIGDSVIMLATTLGRRNRIVFDSWFNAFLQQLLLVTVAAFVSIVGLHNGLRPMMRLRAQLLQRGEEQLDPVSDDGVQAELVPLVNALNVALERVKNHVIRQRRFIADASHQLRTAIAVLKTEAMVGLRDPSSDVKDEILNAINGSLDSLTRVINQLLTLARAEAGASVQAKETVNFVEIVRTALERLLNLALRRHIDISFDCVDETILISAHPVLLQELVANLVENALRYSPEQGAVRISIERHDDVLRLAVIDTGPGVPASEREKVFERFYRGPNVPAEGTGLGLAIVKEVLEAHRGKIQLSDASPFGTGLRVEVFLPLELRA
jgi:two-component system, OmpR family, sensor histidine kinase TctE